MKQVGHDITSAARGIWQRHLLRLQSGTVAPTAPPPAHTTPVMVRIDARCNEEEEVFELRMSDPDAKEAR